MIWIKDWTGLVIQAMIFLLDSQVRSGWQVRNRKSLWIWCQLFGSPLHNELLCGLTWFEGASGQSLIATEIGIKSSSLGASRSSVSTANISSQGDFLTGLKAEGCITNYIWALLTLTCQWLAASLHILWLFCVYFLGILFLPVDSFRNENLQTQICYRASTHYALFCCSLL
jgi:hypothetical protein